MSYLFLSNDINYMEYKMTHELHHKDHAKLFLITGLCMVSVFASLFYTKPHLFAFASASSDPQNADVLLSRAGVSTKVTVGPAVEDLVSHLKAKGITADVIANNTREFFSPEGKVVALLHTNIKVYEYNDPNLLISEREAFEQSAEAPGSWKKNVHLYSNDKVIVFYMGSSKEVTDILKDIYEK